MKKPPLPRPWIKVQLSATGHAQEAAALVKAWKLQRQATAHLVRAVRLYAALCRGDLSLLEAYFPGIGVARSSTHSSRPPLTAPILTFVSKSDTEEINEALEGLGLEGLDFE